MFKEETIKELNSLKEDIKKINKEIFEQPTQPRENNKGLFYVDWAFGFGSESLYSKVESLREDFDELDKKFDRLIDHLKLEFVDEKTEGGSAAQDTKKFVRKVKK